MYNSNLYWEINCVIVAEEKDNVLGNVKYSDMASNEYMRNLFLDPKKNVMQGALASNRNKGYIYMVQKDKKCKLKYVINRTYQIL